MLFTWPFRPTMFRAQFLRHCNQVYFLNAGGAANNLVSSNLIHHVKSLNLLKPLHNQIIILKQQTGSCVSLYDAYASMFNNRLILLKRLSVNEEDGRALCSHRTLCMITRFGTYKSVFLEDVLTMLWALLPCFISLTDNCLIWVYCNNLIMTCIKTLQRSFSQPVACVHFTR